MKNIKSFLTAGTIALGFSVSAFSLPASAAGTTTINNANIATVANYAAEVYTFTSGEYKLGENITLGDTDTIELNGTVVLDLNGHTLKVASIIVNSGDSLEIGGNGTLDGGLAINNGGTLIINNGNYHTINANAGSTVTINGGTFKSTDDTSAIYVWDVDLDPTTYDPIAREPLNIVINGGDFTSDRGIGIEVWLMAAGSSVNINGGSFHGDDSGLGFIDGADKVTLSGGRFVSGDAGHAIKVTSATGPVNSSAISALLADGYEYSDGATVSGTDDYGTPYLGLSAKDVTVRTIGSSTDEGGSETEGGSGTQSGSETEGDSEGGSESGTSDANSSSKSIMSEEMEKVIASATSKGSSKSTKASNKKVKAPNTGVTEGAVATTGATVITMATLAGAGLIIKKKQNR